MIYADTAATTRMSTRAAARMTEIMCEVYGNPSSIHLAGQKAAGIIEDAREDIADILGCAPREIVFTSGGSESDTQALMTAAEYCRRNGLNRVITSTIEHHAVINSMENLKQMGLETVFIDVDGEGFVDPDRIAAEINDETAMVSVMYANNEIGTIEPVDEIGRICREKNVIFHVDAVQAAGHIQLNLDNIDMMSLSAHKFHGPKGIGALYVRKGIQPAKIIAGGEQERNRRAGTENVPAIAAMAEALKESVSKMDETTAYVSGLRDYLIDNISKIPGTILNGPSDKAKRLPGNANFCFDGVDGEALLLLLSESGICASSGSACSAGALEPSHVIQAIGRSYIQSQSSLRLSVDEYNNMDEMKIIVEKIKECKDRLVK